MPDLKIAEKAPTIGLDISRWSFEDYTVFTASLVSGNIEAALQKALGIVVRWDYDIDLASERPDLKLPFGQLPVIVKSIRSTIEAYIESLDVLDVIVDMNKWTMQDFYDFQRATREGNVAEQERLIRIIVRFDKDEKLGERLTFYQGALASKAVNLVMKDMFR